MKTNEDFEAFLTHVQYGWMARKAALASSVVVKLTPIENGGMRKEVTSTFYSIDTPVCPDGTQRTDKDGKKIVHTMVNGALVTDIVGTIVNWTETTLIDPLDNNKLTTR